MIDQLITLLDDGLRNTFVQPTAKRPSPADAFSQDAMQESSSALRKQAAALMRVNHVGEVCAQALYQGQALTSHSETVRLKMHQAAEEEIDHLSWCYQRLEQLNSHTSYLNPVWYLSSLAIGITAGLAGDKWSLGFLAETEKQVVTHLELHLDKLPQEDSISRAIVAQMREDEEQHAAMAVAEGAAELPQPIKILMGLTSNIMTRIAAYI